MLFDLSSGKRKRVVQVVYATLALLLGGGLVLFGIGGAGGGGLLDAVGLGGDGGGGDPQYEEQISDYESQLEQNPNDTAAMIGLLRTHYLSATSSGVESDPTTGQVSISADAHNELEDAAAAWQRYLKTDPERVNTSAATNAVQVYQLLNDAGGAAEAQKVVADAQKSSAAYGQLALFLYADFKFDEADAAAEKAVTAADSTSRKTIQQRMDQYSEYFRKQQQLIKKEQEQQGGNEAAQAQLEDPFGALGGAPSSP
jgi:tetratricopeptide (TPR) repeat protein